MVNGRDAGKDTRLSRSHRLAGGDGYRRGYLRRHARVSARGNVWNGSSDAAMLGFYTGEYCGRVRPSSAATVHSIPSYRARLFEGVGNTYNALRARWAADQGAGCKSGAKLHQAGQKTGFIRSIARGRTRMTIHHSPFTIHYSPRATHG